MQNLLPNYIVKQVGKNIYAGNFKVFSLFSDISGFTATTEELMKHGEEGAEILSDILKYLFNTSVKSVYEHGGFITRYAGDAFTALFEITEDEVLIAEKVLQTAIEINAFFKENKIYHSKFGDFEFDVKIGIAYGDCEWGITGSEQEKSFYFKGDAVDLCAHAEHNAQKGEIWLYEPVYQLLSKYITENSKTVLHERTYYRAITISDFSVSRQDYTPEIVDKKVINLLAGKKESEFPVGEFREIISVFIAFQETNNLQKLMEILYRLRDLYGGSHPVLDFGDKGGNILLFFGTPIAYENNDTRALNFIWQFKKELADEFTIRAGLCKGVVYCGFNGAELHHEFTCLGNTVNQSARFMMKAEWDEIWLDKNLSLNGNYDNEFIGEFAFKGRDGKIPSYRLIGKSTDKTVSFNGGFFGRDREIVKLLKLLSPLKINKFGGCIFIDGNAGIGKSRLVHELKLQFAEPLSVWCHLPCDDIVRSGFNPFVTFIKNIAGIAEENSSEINLNNYQNMLDSVFAACANNQLADKLKSLSGYLKLILGLPSGDPDVEASDAQERYNNILTALKLFIEIYSCHHKTIFEFDNAHHLDADSIKLISQLIFAFKKQPAVFIFGCRLQDNGELIEFDLPGSKKSRVLLKPLTKYALKNLIKNRLKINKLPLNTLKIVYEKGNGNPLFSEQILLFVKDNQIFDNRYRIKGDYDIPTGINQIVISRIDKLKKHLKDLIKTASVLGQNFNAAVLANMLNEKYKNLQLLLQEGQNEDIWQSVSEINYLFKYATIRDVVYDMQLKKTVKELHFLSADALEKSYTDNIEQYYEILAYHYDKAETLDKAMQYLKLAGLQTKANFQNKKAAEYFDKWSTYAELKLGVIDGTWEGFLLTDENHGLVKEYAEVCSIRFYLHGLFFNNLSLGQEIIKTLSFLATLLNDDKIKIGYTIDHANFLINIGNYSQATIMLTQIIPFVLKLNNFNQLCVIYYNLGKINWKIGNNTQAISEFEKALDYSGKVIEIKKRLIITAQIFGSLGVLYDYSGEFDKALYYYNQQLDININLKYANEIAITTGNIGVIHHLKQEFVHARKCYVKKYELCQEQGNLKEISLALNNLGFLESDCKNYKKAINYYKQSIKISELLSDNDTLSNTQSNLANVLKLLKHYEEANYYYLKALKIATEFNSITLVSDIMVELAELNWLLGNHSQAVLLLSEGMEKAVSCNYQDVITKAKYFKTFIK